MAGIVCSSASASLVAGDTSVDASDSGYLTRERIVLGVTGAPTTTVWGLAKPTASAASCALDSTTSTAPTFTPDVEGYYVVTCVVDGSTSYALRLAVASVANVSTLTALRFLPIANASVPAPATGRTLFCSVEENGLAVKLPDNSVLGVEVS